METKSKFELLIDVAHKLNAPGGCPWDIKQTFESLQPYILEEAHEVLEAVDSKDPGKIADELGDLFYIVIFYAQVAERIGVFTLDDVIENIRSKLIRRHPHVFGDTEVKDAEGVVQQWEKIKKLEKTHQERSSILDGIPKTMPTLAKAQKILRKIKRVSYETEAITGEEIGNRILALLAEAEEQGVDAESALRKTLRDLETTFRTWETTQT